MNGRTLVAVTIVAVVLLGAKLDAAEAAERWAWFSASPSGDTWSIKSGEADVEMNTGTLKARLFVNGQEVITLQGTIKSGRVEATAVLLNTDARPTTLVGRYGRTRWKESSWPEREAILLIESEKPWGWTIGLTRELLKP